MCRIIMILLMLSSGATCADGEKVFGQVRDTYKDLKSFRASIVSQVTVAGASKATLTGRVVVKEPDCWKVEIYSEKSGKLLLFNMSDGKHHWILDRKNRRVVRSEFREDLRNALRFFPVFDGYDTTRIKMVKTGKLNILEIPFKETSGPFQLAKFRVSADTNLVQEMELLGPTRHVSMRLVFSEIQVNRNLPADVFRFQAIEGMTLETTVKKEDDNEQR